MPGIELLYTGPLAECGFRGRQGQYLARRGKPFRVAEEDGDELLKRFPDVLEKVTPSRTKRRSGDSGDGDQVPPGDTE